ncbi:MAG: ribonuclease Z [Bacilli bacterium]|nr:ribonuclease Z [Bacilli bacterium]
MKIKMVGTGSMISKRNPASYMINDKVMIDMPNGVVKILKNANLFDNVEYLFITHIHGDHIFDLPFLFLERYKSNRELTVILSRRWLRKIKKLVKLAFPREFYNIFYRSKIKFISNKGCHIIDDLHIERIKVDHGAMKPSFGYIVKEKDKTVTFTGDSALCSSVLESAKISDYLICDCTLSKGNHKHMGVDNIKYLLEENPTLKVVPSHTSINSKNSLLELKYDNLIIKEDMEEIIL